METRFTNRWLHPTSCWTPYASERRPMAKAVVDATSIATRVATQESLFRRRARRHALRLFSRFSGVQRQFSAGIGEHLVNYRDSALVGQDWAFTPSSAMVGSHRDGPQAGEVFRDAYLEFGDKVVPLRHLLRHPGHHLLVFTADIGDPRTLKSWRSYAEDAMGTAGTVSIYHAGSCQTVGARTYVFATFAVTRTTGTAFGYRASTSSGRTSTSGIEATASTSAR